MEQRRATHRGGIIALQNVRIDVRSLEGLPLHRTDCTTSPGDVLSSNVIVGIVSL